MHDPIFDLIEQEKQRQNAGFELIPSENYVSPAVLAAMGSILTNKYSEGYPSFEGLSDVKNGKESDLNGQSSLTSKSTGGPKNGSNIRSNLKIESNPEAEDNLGTENDPETEGAWSEAEIAEKILPNYRYYAGQADIDRIERLAIARACHLFHADHANVQPHSGANANEAVYFAWCEPGDKILAMSLPAGGHLTHGSPVTRSAKAYQFLSYGVTEDGDIDYAELEEKALKERPKIILVGYSAFMKIPDFARIAKIGAKLDGCLLMADMAHVAGLIAGGVHPNPLDYGFHVMTTTTHKTLRGPRGGLILSNGHVASPLKKPTKTLENIPILIDRAVFPGTQGGPLEHIIAAKAVAFGEALKPEFKTYAQNVVDNAKVLADELKSLGFVLQGNGTENHLILANVQKSFGFDGKLYEKALDRVGLTLNANAVPTDQGGAFRPSGVRLGTPAITTRGLGPKEMRKIAHWMKLVAELCITAASDDALENHASEFENIHAEVRALAEKFPVPGCA